MRISCVNRRIPRRTVARPPLDVPYGLLTRRRLQADSRGRYRIILPCNPISRRYSASPMDAAKARTFSTDTTNFLPNFTNRKRLDQWRERTCHVVVLNILAAVGISTRSRSGAADAGTTDAAVVFCLVWRITHVRQWLRLFPRTASESNRRACHFQPRIYPMRFSHPNRARAS